VRVPDALADQPALSQKTADTHETAISWLPIQPTGFWVV
jgi:hypothetical protein